MKPQRLILILALATSLDGASIESQIKETEKHNEKYHQMIAKLNTLLAVWGAECKAHGEVLKPVEMGGDLDCTVETAQPSQQLGQPAQGGREQMSPTPPPRPVPSVPPKEPTNDPVKK